MIGASINTNLYFLLGAISCFIPAIFLLYFTLAPYEKYFKDRPLFLIFMGGMVLGGFIFFFESFIFYPELLLFLIGFPLLEQISKIVILNLPRFQGKMGTTFYGGALGLGFGSSIGFLNIFSMQRGGTDIGIAIWIYLLVLSILLFHCSTGTWLGYGIRMGSKWKYFFYSFLAQIPLYSMIPIMDKYTKMVSPIALVYALILYLYTYRSFLPMSIPDDERRKIRMEKRREKRGI